MTKNIIFIIAVLISGHTIAQQPSPVKVEGGLVQGKTEDGLTVYKGIPFAAPPVGDLRWRPPQPARKWDGIRQADKFAPGPVQGGNPPSGKSEDCLYLNIWTPAKSPRDRIPVLVWIYGGGFGAGSTSEPNYSGENLAGKGVVLVSIAYRVGQPGFLAHPELSAESPNHVSGNYGLLDMIAGLQWVKKNIAAFGGDPGKVTIFGESAGGIAVSMLCASPLAKELFHGAISQSGGSFGPPRSTTYPGENMKRLTDAERVGEAYAKSAGVTSIAELRKIDADKLPSGRGMGMAWPIIDGWVIPDDQYKLYAAGKYNDTPILVGYNSDEGASFSPPKTPEDYIAGVRTRYGKFADDLIKAYPVGLNAVPKTARDLARDAAFGWQTWIWARLQAQTGKSKVFYYYFDQHPDYPDDSPRAGYGSPHGQDVAYVFQHLDASNPLVSKTDLDISEAMATYWTNFAKNGNPGGESVPEWPAFSDANPVVMHFNKTPHTGPVTDAESLKSLDAYFAWRRTPEGESWAQTQAPKPFGPIPNENQIRWQEMEYYAFLHFSINTFTDQEWGGGDESASLFNPKDLDCRQWARVCSEAGMKGIILTVKHHCGFCLWPSKYTEFSVKNSPWKDGKGDVVRELADACKEYGLKLGVYLSPWDRNSADYGKPEYITYFRNQLTELLTNYGPIFEVWFDGANGGSGYYGGAMETRKIDSKTYYDWSNTYALIRKLQSNIVIWNDGGDRGDLRWVGTEAGYVGETNWSLLNAKGDVTNDMLRFGLENGDSWVPAEVNTSIRPGWFYHIYEDKRVKALPQLLNIYYNSAGHNGTLLLNFPIDTRGLIHENDAKASGDLAAAVKETFAVNLAEKAKVTASNIRGNSKVFNAEKAIDGNKDTYWATDDGMTNASLTIDFMKPTTFNRFLVQEYIRLGQRVKTFTVEALVDGTWKEVAKATTIGYKRILRFPGVKATRVRFTITDSKSCPVISNLGIYNAPLILTAPALVRNKSGEINITPVDEESVVYYTLDGSPPTTKSKKYEGPVQTEGKVELQAIAYDPSSGKSSPVSQEKFDISRKDWKIVGFENETPNRILDGNPSTAWHQSRDLKMPVDLVIDLGTEQNLCGFRYLPDQMRATGYISNYQLYVSNDNSDWKLVDEGEFANINNNPLVQVKKFAPVKAKYIKLRALKNTRGNDDVGYAEINVITP